MGETQKHLPEETSVPTKEMLTGPEDTGYKIKRYVPPADPGNIIIPELVFYKDDC